MKIYYIRKNNENLGPFSLEELKSHDLNSTDFVWKEGDAEWLQAKYFDELKDLFNKKTTPPPFYQSSQDQQNFDTPHYAPMPSDKKTNSFWYHLRWIVAIILITWVVAAYLINHNNSNNTNPSLYTLANTVIQKTPEQLRAELAAEEKSNPTKYLTVDATIRSNLIGQKVIEGYVKNTASVATYKDLVFEVRFLNAVKDVLSIQHFRLDDFLPSNGSKSFKYKTFAPEGTDGFNMKVAEASALN